NSVSAPSTICAAYTGSRKSPERSGPSFLPASHADCAATAKQTACSRPKAVASAPARRLWPPVITSRMPLPDPLPPIRCDVTHRLGDGLHLRLVDEEGDGEAHGAIAVGRA